MSRFAILAAFGLSAVVAALPAVAASMEVEVRDPAGRPVADAVVFAMPATGPQETRITRSLAIEQVEREFVPYVSVVQTGTVVTFPNRDPIQHHVYSFSPPKVFEIKLFTGTHPGTITFDKAGLVTLGCNIHDWMVAYLMVVSTPHFATTGANGQARLRDLPSGRYELRAWHPQQREAGSPQAVTLDVAATRTVALALDVAPRKVKFKPPLDRLRY